MTQPLAHKVLLVGWHTADWKVLTPLLDAGQLPCLERLINQGTMGNLTTLAPILPSLLWTSLATGKRADHHGILGPVEPDPLAGGTRLVARTSRKVKAIWNILSERGLRAHVAGWCTSHPAEAVNGVCVSDRYAEADSAAGLPWPLPRDAVYPERLRETLAPLRLHPADLCGAHLLPFVPQAARVDQKQDDRLATLAIALAECVSNHAAATWILEHEPWDFLAVSYQLLGRLGPIFMPYHPPQQEHITREDFELYKDVIAGVYRFLDMLLERLLALAGPEATVLLVSEHGFQAGDRRPWDPLRFHPEAAALWHRPVGILCLAGPPINKDELIHGAGLLDITPTVLTLFGLSVGADMEGHPLLAAFEHPVSVDRIPSWEDLAGAGGRPRTDRLEKSDELEEALAQLAALGYADVPTASEHQALHRCRLYQTFTLARVHLEAGRLAEAAPLFEQLVREAPEEVTYSLFLARCRLALGQLAECRCLLTAVHERGAGGAIAEFLLGQLAAAENQPDAALTWLRRAEQAAPHLAELHCQLGIVYLRLRRWDDAERAFQQTLALAGDEVRAHYGLARTYLEQGRFPRAAEAALTAVTLRHHVPESHYVLGVALARLGRPGRAIQAFETCLALRPQTPAAHAWLAALHEQATGDRARAAEHRRAAELAFQASTPHASACGGAA